MDPKPIISNVPTSVQINLEDGEMVPHTVLDHRHVSHLAESFSDRSAVEAALSQSDPLIYTIYHHAFVTDKTDMAMGMSVIAAGKVGDEYYMTKGHLHESDDQAEIYYCVQGEGYLLMDDLQGDFQAMPFTAGTAVHIPPQYAHRVVNTGKKPLIFVSAFHLAAGHVYQPVAEKGFARIVIEVDGKPDLAPNPRRVEAGQVR